MSGAAQKIYVPVAEMETARVLALRLRRHLSSVLALAVQHRDLIVECESLADGSIPDAAVRAEVVGWNRRIADAEAALKEATAVLRC
jgi:hypothetical protein